MHICQSSFFTCVFLTLKQNVCRQLTTTAERQAILLCEKNNSHEFISEDIWTYVCIQCPFYGFGIAGHN